MSSLLEMLETEGYNKDVEISAETWQEYSEEMHPTSRSLAALEGKKEICLRDDKRFKSLELKDLSQLDGDRNYLAELEHFNPEKHPILHVLVDFPLWLWRNRIRDSNRR